MNLEVSHWPKRVRFGPGSVAELPQLLRELNCARAMVLCGRSVASGPMLAQVRDALGASCVGVFDEIKAHTQLPDVQRAAEMSQALEADVIVSVGGGSAIDAAKGVVLFRAAGGDPRAYALPPRGQGTRSTPLPRAPVRHIAVPTTAGSGSDVMPSAGIRDPKLGKKILFWDRELVPDATILDPRMAIYADAFLTSASGMTAVARALEALYSRDRNPISAGLALQSLRMMVRSLPLSVREPQNLQARLECQLACVMAGTAVVNAMASVVHAIGHAVGGKFQLQHGVAHSILLAPVARRFVPLLGTEGRAIVQAFGTEPAEGADLGACLASEIDKFTALLPLPRRLREVGLVQEDIALVVEQTLPQQMLDTSPRPVDATEIRQILEEAW